MDERQTVYESWANFAGDWATDIQVNTDVFTLTTHMRMHAGTQHTRAHATQELRGGQEIRVSACAVMQILLVSSGLKALALFPVFVVLILLLLPSFFRLLLHRPRLMNTHACMRACACVRACACACVCMHACVCMRACVRACACACQCMRACVCVHACVCVRACMRACVRMRACVCMRACVRACTVPTFRYAGADEVPSDEFDYNDQCCRISS